MFGKTKLFFDHNSPGFPVEKIGKKNAWALGRDIDAREKEFHTQVKQAISYDVETTFTKKDRLVIEDDADYLYAGIVARSLYAKTEKAIKADAIRARQDSDAYYARLKEQQAAIDSTPVSKLFVATTTPPQNLAKSTQKTTNAPHVGGVTKLSDPDKTKLETRSGLAIDTDSDLKAAKAKILANSTSKKVNVVGESNALIVGDPKTVSELESVVGKIEAIETSKGDCPDWMGACPTLPSLSGLFAKRDFLLALNKYDAMFARAKASANAGNFMPDALRAWVRCGTHLAQKGLQGIRTLNQVGSFVSGLSNTNFLKEFNEALADADVLNAVVGNKRDQSLASLGSSNSDEITMDDLATLFSAMADADVHFKPDALLSPFEMDDPAPAPGDGHDYTFSDMYYFDQLAGGSTTSRTEVVEPSVEETSKLAKLATVLNQDPNTMLMQKRQSDLEKSGHMVDKVFLDEEDLSASIAISTGKSANIITDEIASGRLQTVVETRQRTLIVVDQMNRGDMSGIDDSQPIFDQATFRTNAVSQMREEKSVTEFYAERYDMITKGFAAA